MIPGVGHSKWLNREVTENVGVKRYAKQSAGNTSRGIRTTSRVPYIGSKAKPPFKNHDRRKPPFKNHDRRKPHIMVH
ncbi:hypothetical protein LIER_33470 [Lithospermum erythrorhizon]|uniref:Ribosomal protein L2 n=1 Tax=Lithospermum erythrorhizon TaxID=34254 RepID=A0AAV3S0W9_LITER